MEKKNTEKPTKGLAGRIRSSMSHASGKFQESIEEWMSTQSQVNDAQLHALLAMLGSYRDIGEQLASRPGKVMKQELSLLKSHARLLLNSAKKVIGKEAEAVIRPDPQDKRFADQEWENNLLFDYIKQAYLLNTQAVTDLVNSLQATPAYSQEQLKFYTRQLLNALSPTNFLLTNPEVLKRTLSTKGSNLGEGLKNLVADLKKSPGLLNVSMTDYSAFEVGKNVATTPGKVIFQTDMMQLIQYVPVTETVYKTPLLILPPWINKYYILDLKPGNSLVKWLVDQGHQVFMASWVNPGPELRDKGFEHYMTEGALAALDAIQAATGEKSVNVIGYCVGGTLLACTMAYLAAKRKSARIKSATCLTTLLDFTDPGGIGVFINDRTIKAIERQGKKSGYYDGRAMAFSFNLLRENDLLWSFVVNNYLKGQKPSPFDLLYWNSDCTNLTGAMHGWYLRNMYLENKLVQPGGIELAGVKLDLRKVKTPAYFLSASQDHIAKWKTTYKGTHLFSGPVTFVLSGSGHIAGVANPPVPQKYGFATNDQLPPEADSWLKGATQHPGSWWPHWNAWIAPYAGEQVKPVLPGEGQLSVIEDAPGTYVKQRIADVLKEGH
jgi:polyhydroxyalkanoate synthase